MLTFLEKAAKFKPETLSKYTQDPSFSNVDFQESKQDQLLKWKKHLSPNDQGLMKEMLIKFDLQHLYPEGQMEVNDKILSPQ